jgi:hypothetical protein
MNLISFITKNFKQLIFQPRISYTLSRTYPFRPIWIWITFFVFGVALATLTVFNVANVAFSMQTIYTSDPNTTMSHHHWFEWWFFNLGDNQLAPICQKADITVGSEFITTNSGFTYSIQTIYLTPHGSILPQEVGSMSYMNNTLEDCSVGLLNVFLRKGDTSNPGQRYWWSWALSSADAIPNCNIVTDEGLFNIVFTAKYSGYLEDLSYVAVSDPNTRASIWWGSRLLNAYFNGLEVLMTGYFPDSATKNSPEYMNGQLTFAQGNGTSIQSPDLFTTWYYFLASNGDITNQVSFEYIPQKLNNASFIVSRPLTEGFQFAKVFSSLILADLGNSALPNVLLDSDSLQYILNGTDNFNRQLGGPLYNDMAQLDWWKSSGVSAPGKTLGETNSVPFGQAYAAYSGQMGPLGTQESRIYAQYICSVPQKLGFTTIIILVAIADYVALKAVWAVLKFLMRAYQGYQDPTAMYCEGCMQQSNTLTNLHVLEESSRPKSPLNAWSSSTRRLLRESDTEGHEDGMEEQYID